MKIQPFCFFYLVLLLNFQLVYPQSPITGSWEGIFMNDFRTVINFGAEDNDRMEGTIKMFAGENVIQDDKLTDIRIRDNEVEFYIPAKETSFEGSFNNQMTELSGIFIFPDGLKHSLFLKKSMNQTNAVEEYEKLKNKYFTSEELVADLEYLYLKLKEHHPQLNAVTSRDSMDVLAEKLKRKIGASLRLKEFYPLAAQLTDAVRCSHTGVRLPVTFRNLANTYGNYFPLRLFFSDGKAFYVAGCTAADAPISAGQEVVSINNMPVHEIIAQLFYFIPSEASNSTTKYNGINKSFNRLFYLLADSEVFSVKFRTGDSLLTIAVPAADIEDVDPDSRTIVRPVQFNYMDETNGGFLKISTFAIKNMDQYFYQLDSIFVDLQNTNTQNLILDVRDNEGGHPIFAAQLLSYITSNDFIYFRKNDKIEEFTPLYNTMHPNERNYSGKLYVLVNGGCLSTTGHFISLLKYNTNAVFIGEEPGTTFRCNDFSIQISLPHTGIELNVPGATFETAVTGFSYYESFPVDFPVKTAVDELINCKDAVLEKAVEEINK